MYNCAEKFIETLMQNGWTPERLISIFEKLESLPVPNVNDDIQTPQETETSELLLRKIRTFLLEIGFSIEFDGFNYLTSAILQVMKTASSTPIRFTKVIYPNVAKQYGANPKNVIRCINYAIEHCYHSQNPRIIELTGSLLGDKNKLENNKFITFAALYLKQ